MVPAAPDKLGPALLALGGEGEGVLDAAAAAQDVGVVGAGVALADDVGGAEAELGRELRGAGPLDVLGAAPAGAVVGTAHQVDGVLGAEARVRDAPELRDSGHAPVGGGSVAAEGEGLDLVEAGGEEEVSWER